MKRTVKNPAHFAPVPVSGRCPYCMNEVTFDALGVNDITLDGGDSVGHRRCPRPDCKGHVFVVHRGGSLEEAFPPIRIDFDPVNVPAAVVGCFEEAIACHSASCFVASAIMIRRTLEEICADKGAKGPTLKERIRALESRIVVPKELVEAMDELRLLGNDAAHIEAQTYAKIQNDELEIAIEFTKELLKALYQYASLLDKMRALKKSP